MPQLNITKTFLDTEVLFESDLDNIKSDLETFFNVTLLNDDNIQNLGITASSKIADESITTGKFAAAAITTAVIDADAVTDAKLANSASVDGDRAVTTDHIKDSAVTTAKINTSAVTTAKINDGAVTYAKKALNYAISSSCGAYTISLTAGDSAEVTNLSVSITTNGRNVLLMLVPAIYTGTELANVDSSGTFPFVQFKRDGSSIIAAHLLQTTGGTTNIDYQPVNLVAYDNPAAGTYTYSVHVLAYAFAAAGSINYFRLLAVEV